MGLCTAAVAIDELLRRWLPVCCWDLSEVRPAEIILMQLVVGGSARQRRAATLLLLT